MADETTSSDCGCNNTSSSSGCSDPGCGCNNTQSTSCAGSTPVPCCDPDTIKIYGGCLFPTCNVTATDTTFNLSFSNQNVCNLLPVNSDEVYLYHAQAGLMNIHSFSGSSYEVSLTDPTRAGALILKEDCVLPAVIPDMFITNVSRCLSGKFVVPSTGNTSNLFILNGSGIPDNSIVGFTNPDTGEFGQYTVVSLISSSDETYVYSVRNDGSGHTPAGTIIEEDKENGCSAPIEVLDTIDICNLDETQTIDSLSGCESGVPKSLVPDQADQTIVSTSSNTWELRNAVNLDCCLITEAALKFDDSGGLLETDSTTVINSNIDCFSELWDNAQASSSEMVVTIEGTLFRVLNWVEGTRTITLGYTNDDYVSDGNPSIDFAAGTQICAGECCNRCNNENMQTDHKNQGTPAAENNATISINVTGVPYTDGARRYFLIGTDNTDTDTYYELTAGWEATKGTSEGYPDHTLPAVVRHKTCNKSARSCSQKLTCEYQVNLVALSVPTGVRVYAQWLSAIRNSITLEDGSTLASANIAGEGRATGFIEGPTAVSATAILEDTRLGTASTNATTKYLPNIQTLLRSRANVFAFNCANEVVWLMIYIESDVGAGSGTLDFQIGGNRYYELQNINQFTTPADTYNLEQWTGETA